MRIILALVMFIVHIIASIWAVVSFLVWLVKDLPFNWWSVVVCVSSLLIGLILWIIEAMHNE